MKKIIFLLPGFFFQVVFNNASATTLPAHKIEILKDTIVFNRGIYRNGSLNDFNSAPGKPVNFKNKKIGLINKIKSRLNQQFLFLKNFFDGERPQLKPGAFLLGLILGPLAFLFFIKNHDKNFRYSVKVGFVVQLFVVVGILAIYLLL